MRSVIFVIAGFALLALCIAAARSFKPTLGSAVAIAVPVFIVLWLVAAGLNMWIGVSQAGYGVMEELPVFMIIFLLPTAVALLVKWNWR